MPIDFIHDCTLVLYKQLIQTGFGCYPSDFTLSWDFLSTRTRILGEPPHTSLYCFAIEVGFGANGLSHSQPCTQLLSTGLSANEGLDPAELPSHWPLPPAIQKSPPVPWRSDANTGTLAGGLLQMGFLAGTLKHLRGQQLHLVVM